jgi:hypothetical protein
MDNKTMMGLVTPGDQKVAVPIRDWGAMKRGLWRSRTSWEKTIRAAFAILGRCKHAEGCPGKEHEFEPCLEECPDREQRMDALVILNAAREFAPLDARRLANEPYYAPSRERYSDVLTELSAVQAELEAMHAAGFKIEPPPNEVQTLPSPAPPQIPKDLFNEETEEKSE